jgi:SAM-dependent methyltransferase
VSSLKNSVAVLFGKMLRIKSQEDLDVSFPFSSLPHSQACMEFVVKNYDFTTVLDIGSGEGLHSALFSKIGKAVTAVDYGGSIYSEMASDNYKGVDYVVGDFAELELGHLFDCVWCSHVLEHQLNVGSFLLKIKAVLAADGILAITVPPLKNEIVGGHVSLWNAGLVLYRLVLAGFDCNKASVLCHGYNVSVVIRKNEINLPKHLNFDAGDIRKLRAFLPAGLRFNENQIDDPFDGDIKRLNWRI